MEDSIVTQLTKTPTIPVTKSKPKVTKSKPKVDKSKHKVDKSKKSTPDYTLKKWTSLSALRDVIDNSKNGEKVVKFIGYELLTNKYRYSLDDSILTRISIKELKNV